MLRMSLAAKRARRGRTAKGGGPRAA
jgi:hypothetical protein